MNIDLLVKYAMKFVGIRYRWNGKVPMSGLDCSGLVSEILKASSILGPHEELSAQQIYDKILPTSQGSDPKAGSLAFYGPDLQHIDHVAFLIDADAAISAAGGDSTTLLEEDAESRQAFVKVRSYKYRKDFLTIIRPNFPWEK